METIQQVTGMSLMAGAISGIAYGIFLGIIAIMGDNSFFFFNISRWWSFWLIVPTASLLVFTLTGGLGFIASVVLSVQMPDSSWIAPDALTRIRAVTYIIIVMIALVITLIWLTRWSQATLWLRVFIISLAMSVSTGTVIYVINRYLQRFADL